VVARVYDALRSAGEPLGFAELRLRVDASRWQLHAALRALRQDGRLATKGRSYTGRYYVPAARPTEAEEAERLRRVRDRRDEAEEFEPVWNGTMGREGKSLTDAEGIGSSLGTGGAPFAVHR